MEILSSYKNPRQFLREFREKLESRTGISSYDRDSKARVLIDLLQNEFAGQHDELKVLLERLDPGLATGTFLEKLAEQRGVPLRAATFATVEATENNIGFYVMENDFGTYNGGNDIVIPAGTIIYSDANNNESGAVIEYIVTEEVTLGAADTLGFVSARASNIGTASNVGRGILTNHNFTGYTDVATGALQVVNFYSILNGRDAENDRSLRYRLSKNYDRLVQQSDERLRLSSMQIPGVIDARVVPGMYGIGTVGLVILGAENESTPALVQQVQTKVNNFRTAGVSVLVTSAVAVTFDFEIDFVSSKILSSQEETRVRSSIQRSIREYFRKVDIGGLIDYSMLQDQIVRNLAGYGTLKMRSGKDFWERLYVRKGYSNLSTSDRVKVLGTTYSLEPDEYCELGILNINYGV